MSYHDDKNTAHDGEGELLRQLIADYRRDDPDMLHAAIRRSEPPAHLTRLEVTVVTLRVTTMHLRKSDGTKLTKLLQYAQDIGCVVGPDGHEITAGAAQYYQIVAALRRLNKEE